MPRANWLLITLLAMAIGCGQSDPRQPVQPTPVTSVVDGEIVSPPPLAKVSSAALTIAGSKAEPDAPVKVRPDEAIVVHGTLRVEAGDLPTAVTLQIIKGKTIQDSTNAMLSEVSGDGDVTFDGELKGQGAGEYRLRVSWGPDVVAERPVKIGD